MEAEDLTITLSEYIATLSGGSEDLFWRGARWAAEKSVELLNPNDMTRFEYNDTF